ncbi:hypothetical protein B0H14DRAFT_2604264 [Mycena olivaceomarginata]|nr:hypothetical protein B0H14DRAFT_2604264 [Mycena olivaceomarginata]
MTLLGGFPRRPLIADQLLGPIIAQGFFSAADSIRINQARTYAPTDSVGFVRGTLAESQRTRSVMFAVPPSRRRRSRSGLSRRTPTPPRPHRLSRTGTRQCTTVPVPLAALKADIMDTAFTKAVVPIGPEHRFGDNTELGEAWGYLLDLDGMGYKGRLMAFLASDSVPVNATVYDESQYQHTTGLLNKLIRFSVKTGSVTAVAALAKVTLWLSCREWNIHYILYSNMLMATLNYRTPIFKDGAETEIFFPQSSFWVEPGVERSEGMDLNLITRAGVNGAAAHDTIVMSIMPSRIVDSNTVVGRDGRSETQSPQSVE